MKGYHLLSVCLFIAAQASVANAGMRTPETATVANNAVVASSADFGGQPIQKVSKLRHKPGTQTNFDIGGGVVKEMRATSAFVHQSAVKAESVVKQESTDSWLMALAGFGLVFLQLRRKHNSLPQRRIAPYA